MLDLDQREIPEEGLPIEGEIVDDIFQLAEDSVVPVSPVHYRARAYVIGGDWADLGDPNRASTDGTSPAIRVRHSPRPHMVIWPANSHIAKKIQEEARLAPTHRCVAIYSPLSKCY